MMQSLPSPRYHEFQTSTDSDDKKTLSEDEEKGEIFFDDDERAWSDITARDPGIAQRKVSRKSRIWTTLTSIRSLLDTLLLLIILGLLLDRGRQKPAWLGIGADITGFAPTISQQITTFAPDPMFVPENGSEFFSDSVQGRWLSIVPRGLGYVRINNTESYNNLPTPLEQYPDSTFTTSVTHQLHCLHSIIEVVAAYTSKQLGRLPAEGPWHLSHCFEYLRQSIMCSSDLAIEGQHTTFPPGFTGSDGWDAKHVCRDYNQVLAHLERNRVNDERWI